MATTNYNLPTILGTNAFDLVTDYNALSNAIDTALAQLAETIPTDDITELQGQVSALQNTTAVQTQNINVLTSQITAANDNISGLATRVTNAEGSIGTLQSGLQTANTNISNINSGLIPAVKGNLLRAEPGNFSEGSLLYKPGKSGSWIDLTLCVNEKAQLVNIAIANIPDSSAGGIGCQSGEQSGCYVLDLTDYSDYLPSRNLSTIMFSSILSYPSTIFFVFGYLDVPNKKFNIVFQATSQAASTSATTIVGGNMMWFYGVTNGVTI